MERTTQSRHKVSDGEQNTSSVDRLSGLPDDIICNILSFLPTKISVATSILARRWRFLWTRVPNLDFGVDYKPKPRSFSKIITRVMFLHKVQSLNNFRLLCMFVCNEPEFETWITTAISRNVKNLDVRLGYHHRKLPECLFTSTTLVDLRLEACAFVPLNGAVCLPNLKKLHLHNVQIDGDETLPDHLISSCPMLEKLIIERILNYKLVSCNISSPTVKKLKVGFEQVRFFGIWRSSCRLQINTPALRYLQLQLFFSDIVSAQTLTSLIEADIHYNVYDGMEKDYYYNLSMLNFLDSLCNVKCLKLSFSKSLSNRLFADQSKSIRRFDNLTKLELAVDCFFIVKFLESAENLEILIIRKGHKKLKSWMEPFEQVPKCLLSHLRFITIDHFGFAEAMFNMVRYMLRNAKVLKRIEIYFKHHGDEKVKFEAIERISLFEQGSEACQLAFYD